MTLPAVVTLRPRPHQAPRLLVASWALSVATGSALVALGPHPPRPEPHTLSPYSVAAFLRTAAGPDARAIRVNGLYGSGHHGAWQFVAHLTWTTPDGHTMGGTTTLPQLAGHTALDSTFDRPRLEVEEHLGWTLDTLAAVLDSLPGTDAPLAMVELNIPTAESPETAVASKTGEGIVTFCHDEATRAAVCLTRSEHTKRPRTFADELTDQPLLDALSVQRTSTPIGG
jgi:hypothetical protein